jgi:circadian clock protein KaiC
MVIDPLSAIAKAGGMATARAVANRLIYLVKDEKVTVVITAINEGDDPQREATELQISTVADTWIHLSYLVRSGERNRALTIIKSRGTWHSNQVRELILGKTGPMLSDVYTAGGEVLMGTLRWEKEAEELSSRARSQAEIAQKHRELEFAEARINNQIKILQLDLQRKRAELALDAGADETRKVASTERESELRRRRSADRRPSHGKGGNGAMK